MKKIFVSVLLSALTAFAAEIGNTSAGIKIPDTVMPLQNVPVSVEVKFPAVPGKTGMVPVLKARFYYKFPRPAGWNNATVFELNEDGMDWFTDERKPRLLFRGKEMKTRANKTQKWFAGGWLFYYCDGEKVDKRIAPPIDSALCWYYFDVSDLVNADKENILKITSRVIQQKNPVSFCMKDAEIIYLPEKEVEKGRTGN